MCPRWSFAFTFAFVHLCMNESNPTTTSYLSFKSDEHSNEEDQRSFIETLGFKWHHIFKVLCWLWDIKYSSTWNWGCITRFTYGLVCFSFCWKPKMCSALDTGLSLESGPLDIEFRIPWSDEPSPAVKNSASPNKSGSPSNLFWLHPPLKGNILCPPQRKKIYLKSNHLLKAGSGKRETFCWNLSFHHLHPSFLPAKHSAIFQTIEALRLAHRSCLITTCTTSLHDTSHVEAMYYSLPFLHLLHGAQMENCLGMFPFNLLWKPKPNVHFKYSSLRTFSVLTFRQVDPRHLQTARKKRCFVEQFFRMVVRLVVSLLSIYFGYLCPWDMVSGPYSVSHPIIVPVR